MIDIEATLWSAAYDALGRRVRTVNGATTTHYYYDGQNVVAEYTWNGSSETLKRYYVHGATYIDERAVMRVIGNTSVDYYYFPRELWSVEGLVNNRGHEVERYRYTAYGDPFIFAVDSRDVNYDGYRSVADRNAILIYAGQAPCTAGPIYDLDGDGDIDSVDAYRAYSITEAQLRYSALVFLDTSGITNPYLFTGQPLDAIDGGSLYLYHYRARAYDPTHGRFMQRDPLGNQVGIRWGRGYGKMQPQMFINGKGTEAYSDGMNLYQYVRSNPAKFVDSYGYICGPDDWHDYIIPDKAPLWFGWCDFSQACQWHDNCYTSCGKTKEQCDKEFHNIMINMTSARGYGAWGHCSCGILADIYYEPVRNTKFAQKLWDASQKKYCSKKDDDEEEPIIHPCMIIADNVFADCMMGTGGNLEYCGQLAKNVYNGCMSGS
ncbi:MAG: hypothetical protein HJJLKODD_02914 [Phycisphaerae bacterium]|nr:hypothetical protein [Phycisphaerae bacterium]